MIRQATTRLLCNNSAAMRTSISRAITQSTTIQQLSRLSYSGISLLNRRFQFHEGYIHHPQQRYTEPGEWVFSILVLGLGLATAGSVTLMEAHANGAFERNHHAKNRLNDYNGDDESDEQLYGLLTNDGRMNDGDFAILSTAIASMQTKLSPTLFYHGHSNRQDRVRPIALRFHR